MRRGILRRNRGKDVEDDCSAALGVGRDLYIYIKGHRSTNSGSPSDVDLIRPKSLRA